MVLKRSFIVHGLYRLCSCPIDLEVKALFYSEGLLSKHISKATLLLF